MPAGSENPSAAFLAGQQHGRTLAVQHKTKPVAKKAASPQKPVAKPVSLLDQAKALAGADTQSQVKAILAQQDLYNTQAQGRAQQINLAAQAAAKYLTGIGDQTAGSYQDAAKTLAGFASGYSGDLRATAEGAAAQQQQALAGLGAPAEGLKTPTGPVGSPTSLANVLYGLGGVIPSTLLVTAGQAQAGAQRQLPAATLGYGQQEALGVLGAGAKQADTLTPALLDAQGKLPALTQQYLAALQDREHQLFGEKLDLAKYGTSIDQFNQRQGLNERKYETSTKLSVQRLNLEAQRIANQAYQSDRTYAVSLANLGISQKKLQLQALADEYKLNHGGFSQKDVTALEGKALAVADDAYKGVPGVPKYDKNGVPMTNANGKPVWAVAPLQKLNYQQALREARKEGVPVSIAVDQLNQLYQPGERGRPLSQAGFNLSAPDVSSGTVVASAQKYLGVPYKWGGNNPKTGLDCSAFIQQVFAEAGIKLPRTTYLQVKYGSPVMRVEDLQPGDVIFTRPGKNGPRHVGLYIGNGQVQESPHTGDVNKTIDLGSYLSGGLVAIRRYANVG